MKVVCLEKKLDKQIRTKSEAVKALGKEMADKLHARVKQVESASLIQDLLAGVGKWEGLSANRSGTYSAHLTANYRIIVSFSDDETECEFLEIVDYHGNGK